MAVVRFRLPDADVAVVLFTIAVSELLSTSAAEMVVCPVPAPVTVMVAPLAPPSRMSLDPVVPVVIELVKVEPMSEEIDPTVKPVVPESTVTARFAVVGLVKVAESPTPLGLVPPLQLASVAQLPLSPA